MASIESVDKVGKRIAITGKGGSGKTMLSACIIRLLTQIEKHDILAIDADSSVNLPYALGVDVQQTVAHIRKKLIEDPEEKARIQEIPMGEVIEALMSSGQGFRLLVMGRPEGPGCYCGVNDLLKFGIENNAKLYDFTVIDCEAGPEQVNRRVLQGIDVLMIVTDASIRGARVAGSIFDVIKNDESMQKTRTGLVINRFAGNGSRIVADAKAWGLEIFGTVPEDEIVSRYDADGRPLAELPETSPSLKAVRKIVDDIIVSA